MRRILIVLLLLLCGCNDGGGNSFPWKSQPHLGAIPPVIGKWFTPSATLGFDTQVYHAAGDTTSIPPFVAALAAQSAQQAIGEVIPYCKAFGLSFTQAANPTVTVRFYYGPWKARTAASAFSLALPPFADSLIVSSKTSSSYATPPPASSNYLGCAYVSAQDKNIHGAVVWINAYVWQDLKQQAASRPELHMDWQAIAAQFENSVTWHELFHVVGLNDDPLGTAPGLMVYRARTPRPSQTEADVCAWLYK
jgi:hypothetical protein